jgi:diguanylate cyclase (GGDEF)-like protein
MRLSEPGLSILVEDPAERSDAPAPTAHRILVVEDDPDIARFLEMNLRMEGYEVGIAVDGAHALTRASEMRPDLILLDVLLPPGIDGLEVARRLRGDPSAENTSIIMVTCLSGEDDRVLGLASGADDYVTKPFYPQELMERVRGLLRRTRRLRDVSPHTHLPGNVRIEEELQRVIADGRSFSLLSCDLDGFKAFNDRKGFSEGDRLLRATAETIQEAVAQLGRPDGFTGHLGGDDFVAIIPPAVAEDIAVRICRRFDDLVPSFYDAAEARRGLISALDRRGVRQEVPLATISIGIATTATRRFRHPGEAVAVATEMKGVAKRRPGSSYAIDRRTTLS